MPNPKESNYYYEFSMGSKSLPDIPVRNEFHNLKKNPECVISYPGSHLMDEIWITGLPLPAGIDELQVAVSPMDQFIDQL